jgi:hypothetical protein
VWYLGYWRNTRCRKLSLVHIKHHVMKMYGGVEVIHAPVSYERYLFIITFILCWGMGIQNNDQLSLSTESPYVLMKEQ